MKRLSEKLKSRDGASLLISLLVFLLCVMVAATVLAAAVSNAGKARSDRAEQQRYQTLSSAVRLVCDGLEEVEYLGKYNSYTWEDPLNNTTKYYYCEQSPGEVKMQSGYETRELKFADDFSFMKDNLKKEMNDAFGQRFLRDGCKPLEGDEVITEERAAEAANKIRLAVTLPDNLAGYPYEAGSAPYEEYGIPQTANIEIKLDHKTARITLTAWLNDDPASSPTKENGVITAELALTADSALVPDIPDWRHPGTLPSPKPSPEPKTVTVKWKLVEMKVRTAP